jgi:hypothetical protein
MNLDDLDRAVTLKAELLGWEKALSRVDRSVFKSAELVITDVAHGHMGQQSQSKIAVDRDLLVPWIEARIAELRRELRDLGISVA